MHFTFISLGFEWVLNHNIIYLYVECCLCSKCQRIVWSWKQQTSIQLIGLTTSKMITYAADQYRLIIGYDLSWKVLVIFFPKIKKDQIIRREAEKRVARKEANKYINSISNLFFLILLQLLLTKLMSHITKELSQSKSIATPHKQDTTLHLRIKKENNIDLSCLQTDKIGSRWSEIQKDDKWMNVYMLSRPTTSHIFFYADARWPIYKKKCATFFRLFFHVILI